MTSWPRGCDDFVSGRRSADVVVYCTCTARGLGGVAGSSPIAQRAVGRLRRWMRVKCCVCLTACSFRNYAEFVTRSCWFCAPSSGEVSVRPSSCSVPRMAAWMKRVSALRRVAWLTTSQRGRYWPTLGGYRRCLRRLISPCFSEISTYFGPTLFWLMFVSDAVDVVTVETIVLAGVGRCAQDEARLRLWHTGVVPLPGSHHWQPTWLTVACLPDSH